MTLTCTCSGHSASLLREALRRTFSHVCGSVGNMRLAGSSNEVIERSEIMSEPPFGKLSFFACRSASKILHQVAIFCCCQRHNWKFIGRIALPCKHASDIVDRVDLLRYLLNSQSLKQETLRNRKIKGNYNTIKLLCNTGSIQLRQLLEPLATIRYHERLSRQYMYSIQV